MYKYIFYDFDGTIVNNLSSLKEIYYYFLKTHGISNDNSFESVNGPDLSIIIKKIKKKYKLDNTEKQLMNEYKLLLKKSYKICKPNDNLFKLLDYCKLKEIKCAIVSSNSYNIIDDWLKRNNLKKYFEFIISSGKKIKSKPDPQPYKIAIKKTNTDSKKILVIEDSVNGIYAATQAGLDIIKYNNSKIKEGNEKNFNEIINYLTYRSNIV